MIWHFYQSKQFQTDLVGGNNQKFHTIILAGDQILAGNLYHSNSTLINILRLVGTISCFLVFSPSILKS